MNKPALVSIGLGVLVLAALFLLFKPTTSTPPAGGSIEDPQVFVFAVRHGAKVSGPQVATVMQGAKVQLRVSSDNDDELHVHGYDLEAKLSAGEPQTLAFTATHAGRFAIELHKADIELSVLQVLPR